MKSNCWAALVFASLLALITPLSRAGEQCHYTWVAIPNPTGYGVYAEAINNHGHLAGWMNAGGDFDRAFVWTPETGTVQIPRPPGVLGMAAEDINDHGIVVGQMAGQTTRPGFIWDGQRVIEIPMPAWANVCEPLAINNRGQVVGMVQNVTTGPTRGFLYGNGVFTVLGEDVQRTTDVLDVSDNGELVGQVTYPGGYTHACRFVDGQTQFLPEPDGISRSRVEKITNNGVLAGWVATDNYSDVDGAIWQNERSQFIETSGDIALLEFLSVNDAGRMVARGRPSLFGDQRWLVWQSGNMGDLRDLLIPSVNIIGAYDINQRGQIAAHFLISGQGRSGVLTPVWTIGDLTGDCRVTIDDLALVLSNFGSPIGTFPMGDVDLDGDVDLPDLAILLTHWGE